MFSFVFVDISTFEMHFFQKKLREVSFVARLFLFRFAPYSPSKGCLWEGAIQKIRSPPKAAKKKKEKKTPEHAPVFLSRKYTLLLTYA